MTKTHAKKLDRILGKATKLTAESWKKLRDKSTDYENIGGNLHEAQELIEDAIDVLDEYGDEED